MASTLLIIFVFVLISNGQSVDSLLKLIEKAPTHEKPQILIKLCDGHMNYDNQAALSYIEEAVEISRELKDSASLAKASTMMGELLTVFERFTEARLSLEEALSIAQNLEDQAALSDAHGALGGLYFSLFDYKKSLHHYKLGTNLAREINDVILIAKNIINMASLFEVQGDFDLALKSFEECAEVLEGTEWENHRFYYTTLLNSGMVSNSLGKHDLALVYMQSALTGFKTLGVTDLEVHTIVGLVHTYTKLGLLDSAIAYHQQTLRYDAEIDMSGRRHYRDQTYIQLLFEMQRYGDVLSLAKSKLKEIEADTNSIIYAVNAAQMAYKAHKALGDDKNALVYLERYQELNGYAQAKATEEEVLAWRTRFETELDFEASKREILELELKEDLQQKEIDKQKNWRNSILAISLLGLIISLLILQSLKLQKRASEAESIRLETSNSKLQMELEYKNRELASTAMFVAQKNQLLMNLQEHLSKLFKSESSLNRSSFRAIQNEIKDNIRLEDDWDNIKLHFDQVYPEFFSKLKSKHPDLTPLELKHCAYLRMSLSVKEVARMLSVAAKSVQMSHYRLKKKLELSTEDSLRDYLSGF
ncbi:MAG: tetratricopeptide repeat protein [Bacteroidia bacterium]